jgi:RimJ/RimL family protein N-acetyltransferase
MITHIEQIIHRGGRLEVYADTLFASTTAGRIDYETDPKKSPGPRMWLAGGASGNVVRYRRDVSDETVQELDALVAEEIPLQHPESTPVHLSEYVDLLSREMPVQQESLGMIYRFPDELAYEHDVTLVRSETAEGDELLGRLAPERARGIWAPWCIALHEGEVATVAMTARIGPRGAEAGVYTDEELRGRGYATAATAGWASLASLRGRILVYSTQRRNVSSQRVADRLGLRFVGSTLRLT